MELAHSNKYSFFILTSKYLFYHKKFIDKAKEIENVEEGLGKIKNI
jgi:hypothetical protein